MDFFITGIMGGMNALDELRLHTAKEREATRLRRHLAEQREHLVKAAFDAGHTGNEVAAAAGISKNRAYQLRDRGQRLVAIRHL